MIISPDDSLKSELIRLWKTCFPEDSEYCDFYFNNCYKPERCLALMGENGLESAFYWFDGELHTDKKTYKVIFLYAGATYSQFRCKGNIASMFSEIKDYCIKNDIAAFILSALSTSRGVSEKYGLIPNIRHRETVCECRASVETAELSLCGEDEFKKMREKYLLCIPYSVAWSDYDMSYMFNELNYSGSILKMTYNDEMFYAVTEIDGDLLLIKETNISQKLFQLLIDNLSAYFSECNEIKIHTPVSVIPEIVNIKSSHPVYYGHTYFVSENPEINEIKETEELYINLTAE